MTSKTQCVELATLLSARLGGDGIERAVAGDPWRNVRARVDADRRVGFLDFAMGGGAKAAVFRTDRRGALHLDQPGDAFGYFTVRIDEQSRGWLEVRAMAADWHLGTRGCDPSNIDARIALAHRLAHAGLPESTWQRRDEKAIDRRHRSTYVWRWRERVSTRDLEAFAARVEASVRESLSLLVEAMRAG